MKKIINLQTGIYHDLQPNPRGGFSTRCSPRRFGGVAEHEYHAGTLDSFRGVFGYRWRGLRVGVPDGRFRRCKKCEAVEH